MYKNAYGNGKIEMKKLPFNCLTGDFFFFTFSEECEF